MSSLLQSKLEAGRGSGNNSNKVSNSNSNNAPNLSLVEAQRFRQQCATEIRALHAVFVTWFRGASPISTLQQDLQQRLNAEFSHVAPNGHMVQGRDILLSYLTEKYGCYRDRIFCIDVYNVQVLWTSANQCLASYEEWQSWEEDNEASLSTNNLMADDGGDDGGVPKGKQQFGRLSTCLLEFERSAVPSSVKKGTGSSPTHSFRWIHVHETWLESEEPVIRGDLDNDLAASISNLDMNANNAGGATYNERDDDTAMTGPVPIPSHSLSTTLGTNMAVNATSRSNHSTANTTISTNASLGGRQLPSALQPAPDDDETEADGGDDGDPTNESSYAESVLPVTEAASQSMKSNSSRNVVTAAAASTAAAAVTTAVSAASMTPTTTAANSASAPTAAETAPKAAVPAIAPTPELPKAPAPTAIPPPPAVAAATIPSSIRRKVIVLVDSSAASVSPRRATAVEAQTKAQQILTDKVTVDFEWVDSAHPAQWNRRDELLLACPRTADTTWPQFFVVDVEIKQTSASTPRKSSPSAQFWGSWEDFERCFEAGTLQYDLLQRHQAPTAAEVAAKKAAAATATAAQATVIPVSEPKQDDTAPTNTMANMDGKDETNDIQQAAEDEDDEEGDDDKDNEDDEDGVDEGEEEDKFDDQTPMNPQMTKEEQQFLENSQGILFFEDEDAGPSNGPSPSLPISNVAIKSAGTTLDDLMERESETADGGPNQKSWQQSQADLMNSSQAMLSLHSAADASHKRHVSQKLDQYATPLQWEGALVGVSIAGFDIGTSQGPIADADWYADKTTELTATAQFRGAPGRDVTRRKIVLPEMVFPIAHVALEGHGIWLSWDAADCLDAWAKSHANIAVRSTAEHNGVSVLKSKDAALWENQRKRQEGAIDDTSAVFHYDWTYSSPFSVKTEGGEWVELDESGMRMDLLTDQSVSILFFDEIVLYEDDLHDNGQVQYSVKLRIMPTCAYVLARLFVRVDHVVVRVRETRILVDFFGIQPQVYRDVSWRECAWEDLAAHGLPKTVTAWTSNADGSGSNSPEAMEWHNLIQRLPDAPLPDGMFPFAVLEYGVSLVSIGESGTMAL